jgi:hypothetical protein
MLIQSFGEQEKSGSKAERRQRGAAVEGDFCSGLGNSVETISGYTVQQKQPIFRAIYSSC